VRARPRDATARRLAAAIAAPMMSVQRRDGRYRGWFGGGSRYGDAVMGYGLLLTGVRAHDRDMVRSALRAITFAVRHSAAHAHESVFEDMAVASAYNLARRQRVARRGFRRVRPAWGAYLRTRHLICLDQSRGPNTILPVYYANHCLVDAVAVLELARSGLSSADPLAIVGGARQAAVERARTLVNTFVPRLVAATSVPTAAGHVSVLSDPPDEPLAYAGLSIGMYARAIVLLGQHASRSARRALVMSALGAWSLAGPDADVGYFGRNQEEAWALSGTALGAAAAAALPGTGPQRVADLHALADRVLERLWRYGFGHFGLFVTPAVREDRISAPSGLDSNAGGTSFAGVTLVMLDWALPRLDRLPGSIGRLAADRDGATLLGTGNGRLAVVRHGRVWFAVRGTRSSQRPNDLRYDLGLVALKVRGRRGWRDVAPVRPLTAGQPDSAGPTLGGYSGALAMPYGNALRARRNGTVELTGGWRTPLSYVASGLDLHYAPTRCGVRMVAQRPDGRALGYSVFFAHRPHRTHGALRDRNERVRVSPHATVTLEPGYASADDPHLVRARLAFAVGPGAIRVTVCSTR
jgi:hypothetical protein